MLHGLQTWLEILGYSPLAIPAILQGVQQFMIWLGERDIHSLDQLQAIHANEYMAQQQQRLGQRTGRPLTTSFINKQIQALLLFCRYLRETGRYTTGFNLRRIDEQRPLPVYLTQEEIQQLYEVTADSVLGMRDRAMLAV